MVSMRLVVPSLVLASAALWSADVPVVEEIIAKCNGDIVTRGDIDRARKELAEGLQRDGQSGIAVENAVKQREKDMLRDRIDRLLLVQKANDLKINVDGDVTKRMASIQKDSGIADPEKFQDWIKEAERPFLRGLQAGNEKFAADGSRGSPRGHRTHERQAR